MVTCIIQALRAARRLYAAVAAEGYFRSLLLSVEFFLIDRWLLELGRAALSETKKKIETEIGLLAFKTENEAN